MIKFISIPLNKNKTLNINLELRHPNQLYMVGDKADVRISYLPKYLNLMFKHRLPVKVLFEGSIELYGYPISIGNLSYNFEYAANMSSILYLYK